MTLIVVGMLRRIARGSFHCLTGQQNRRFNAGKLSVSPSRSRPPSIDCWLLIAFSEWCCSFGSFNAADWRCCHFGCSTSVDGHCPILVPSVIGRLHRYQGPDLYAFIRIYRIYRPWWWWYQLILNINIWLLICNIYYRTMFNTYNLYHQGL